MDIVYIIQLTASYFGFTDKGMIVQLAERVGVEERVRQPGDTMKIHIDQL